MQETKDKGSIFKFNKEDFEQVVESVGEFVPTLLEPLHGPDAEIISRMIAAQFKVSISNPEELAQVIKIDPDAKFKLLSVLYQVSQTQLLDAQSEIIKHTRDNEALGKRNFVQTILSFVVVGGFFLVIALIFLTSLDKADHDVLYLMIGALIGSFSQVINYHLGTSVNEQTNKKT